MVSDILRSGTRLDYHPTRMVVGEPTGKFTVKIIDDLPVFHAEYVTGYGQKGGQYFQENYCDVELRPVTIADMMVYQSQRDSATQSLNEAWAEVGRSHNRTRFYAALSFLVIVYDLLHRLNAFGVL